MWLALSAQGGFKRCMVTGLSALALQGIGLAVVGVAPAYALWPAEGAMFFHKGKNWTA